MQKHLPFYLPWWWHSWGSFFEEVKLENVKCWMKLIVKRRSAFILKCYFKRGLHLKWEGRNYDSFKRNPVVHDRDIQTILLCDVLVNELERKGLFRKVQIKWQVSNLIPNMNNYLVSICLLIFPVSFKLINAGVSSCPGASCAFIWALKFIKMNTP